MKAFLFVEQLAVFHRLVMQEVTGNADEFAFRLSISRASLYRLLDTLSDYGIEIAYSRERNTYYHPCKKNVRIKILITQLSDEELEKEHEKV